MGDFKISGHEKPSGFCIWLECGKRATQVVRCTKKPMSMEACDDHAKVFVEGTLLTPDGKGISVKVIVDDV